MKNFKKFLCVWMVFSLMILCGGNQIVYAVTPTEIFNYYDEELDMKKVLEGEAL